MSDIERRIAQSAPEPARPLDPAQVWRRARRRRQRRLSAVTAAAASLVLLAGAGLVVADPGVPQPVVDAPDEQRPEPPEEAASEETGSEDPTAEEDGTEPGTDEGERQDEEGEDAPSPSSGESSSDLLWCQGVTFPVENWQGRESLPDSDELTAAVRDTFDPEMQDEPEILHMLEQEDVDHLELVHRDDHEALLVIDRPSESAGPGRPARHLGIVFEQRDGQWTFRRSGGCVPEVRHPSGARRASWEPVEAVQPETTRLEVAVRERMCASGQSADDRLLPPEIELGEDAVVVTWFVEPVPGGATCPGNPATAATLELPEPLGDRELLDGGVYPPRAPSMDR